MALFDALKTVLTPYAEKINEIPLYSPLVYSKRKTIADNTDIDTVLEPGEYRIASSTHAKTMVNLPSTMSGVLTVITAVNSSTYFQTYRPVSSIDSVYLRTKTSSSNAWSNWNKLAYEKLFENVSKIVASEYEAIPNNTDLNTITTPGSYKATTASVAKTLVNSPFSNSGFNLRVFGLTSTTSICQMAINAAISMKIYIRYGNDGVYTDWKLLNTDIDGEALSTAINSIGESVTNHSSRISALEEVSGIDSEYFTPFETEEAALYRKVNNDIDNNTLVFVVSADNHYRETMPEGEHQVYHAQVMAKIAKRLRADAIINLGDIITQYIDSIDDPVYSSTDITPEEVNTTRLAKMATAFQSTGVPFLYTFAHHEMCLHTNSPSSTDNTTQTSVYPYPREKVLGLCGKGAEWIEEHHYSQDPLSAGFYVDFSKQKVRIIFLDSVSYTACGYTPSSISFISEAFSNVPNGYKVLVCTHVATREPGVYSGTIKNWEQVEAIMDTYVSNGGTILAELHGHSHFDNIVWIDNVPYPYICICCAENSWSTVKEKVDAGVMGNPVSYKAHSATRGSAIGTYNEWLFDVVCVHPDTNTIKLFRFGIGSDRTVTLS